MFREEKLALPNDTEYVKKKLEGLSNNIRVVRHPKKRFFMWSHHEKSVTIDQKIGYVGGLDLCYGRYEKTDRFNICEPNPNSKNFVYIRNSISRSRLQ